MAHKINPYGNRLGLQQTWWTTTHYNSRNKTSYTDFLIRTIIEGVFKQYHFYSSPIVILRSAQKTTIRLNIFKKKPRHILGSNWLPKQPKRLRNLIRKNKINENPKYRPTKSWLAQHPSPLFIIYWIKYLLTIRFNSPFDLQVVRVPNVFYNVKLFSDFFAEQIFKNPFSAYRTIRFASRSFRRQRAPKKFVWIARIPMTPLRFVNLQGYSATYYLPRQRRWWRKFLNRRSALETHSRLVRWDTHSLDNPLNNQKGNNLKGNNLKG